MIWKLNSGKMYYISSVAKTRKQSKTRMVNTPFMVLTPDGLRFICEANNYDPKTIGKHMLDVLARFQAEGNL